MKINFSFICLFTCWLCAQIVQGQTKHALIVAIGSYPNQPEQKKNWSDLSSKNDADILEKALIKQGFLSKNIHSLIDSAANLKAIVQAFDQMEKQLKPGDIVWFHFSGHGQQIEDLNHDEPDHYDEALITYAAPTECVSGYLGEDHLTDDQLQLLFSKITTKLTQSGHLLVSIDACHSGTASRGIEDLIRRGTDKTFDFSCHLNQNQLSGISYVPPRTTEWEDMMKEEKNKASMVVISGCSAQEVNYEYKVNNVGYGTLTWALCEAMNDASFAEMSYQQMFLLIRQIVQKNILKISQYGKFKITQSPQFEGNIHSLVLNGKAQAAAPFFEVSNSMGLDIELNAGLLNGIALGDSIDFALIEKPGDVLIRGVVLEVNMQHTLVHVTKKVLEKNAAKYQATIGYSPVKSKPLLFQWAGSQKKNTKIETVFQSHPNIRWGSDLTQVDYIFEVNGKNWIIKNTAGKPVRNMVPQSIDSLDVLNRSLGQIERVDQFKKLEYAQSSAKIDWEYIPIEKCETCEISDNPMDFSCIKMSNGFYKKTDWKNGQVGVMQQNHSMCMIVVNRFDTPRYLTVINFLDDESIQAGKTFKLPSDVVLNPHQPYKLIMRQTEVGKEIYKYIISEEPLQITNSSIFIEGARQSGKRGVGNGDEIFEFLAPSEVGKRGIQKDMSIEVINFPITTTE